MPVTRNWNIEWRNHNAQRAYPLTQDATQMDVTGSFRLPQDLLIGLLLSVPASLNVDLGRFLVHRLRVHSLGLIAEIGYDDGDSVSTVATGMAFRGTHQQDGPPYRLGGIGDWWDANGSMVIGKFDNLDLQPAGDWTFDLAGGRLEPDCIRPQIRGIPSIRVQNGSDISEPISQDIILRAGNNARISLLQEDGEDPALVFEAIEGEGLNEECICDGDTAVGEPIRSINNVFPNANGELTLLGSACLEITAVTNGLQLENPCAEPCCGCDEKETVKTALDTLIRQISTLERVASSLEARVTQTDQVILGSKLGDRGCSL